jgi:hypothetical protein
VAALSAPLDEDGCTLRDRQNPDPALRARPVVGLEVLRGLREAGNGAWSHRTVGVSWLGRTTRWVRVGREHLLCR